jgi:hypothetical protein
MADKIPAHILKEAIVVKFGNLSKLAKKLKVSNAYITRAIVTQKTSFVKTLEKAGLKLKDVYSMVEEESKVEREQISTLEKRILELEKLLKEKDIIIEHQSKLLEQYKLMLNKKGAAKK